MLLRELEFRPRPLEWLLGDLGAAFEGKADIGRT
jgi:hypothetical protein